MIRFSYWERDALVSKVECAIIGSGIVGINAALAYRKHRPDASILVLERGMLPTGASTRNAGFACIGSATELLDDLQEHSEQELIQLVRSRWAGLKALRQQVGDRALRYEPVGGYEWLADSSAADVTRQLPMLNRLLEAATGHDRVLELVAPSQVTRLGLRHAPRGIVNRLAGCLHPGYMMRTLIRQAQSQGVTVYCGADITGIHDDGTQVYLQLRDGRYLTAARAIVATNGFARQLLPTLELHAVRNQVLVTAPIPHCRIKGTFHHDRGYYYVRHIGQHQILIGGGRHTRPHEETTDSFGTSVPMQAHLLDFLMQHFDVPHDVQVADYWSGILGVGRIKKPILAHTSERVVVAVRMGGMGVAIGTRVGREAASLILSD